MPMTYRLAEFNPMTYDEIVKPLQLQTDLLNQYEDALGTLDAQASIWEKLANSALDELQYKVYKNYSDRLHLATAQLMLLGLTPGSRALVNSLKTSYAKDILPISDAWTSREKLKEEERKADLASNGRIRREKSAYDRGLGDFMAGMPETRQVNLASIESTVGARALTLQKQLLNPESKEKLNALQYKISQQLGVSVSQLMDFCNDPNSNEALPVLKALYNDALEESGVMKWSNRDEILPDVLKAIKSGLYHSLGENKSQYWTDEVAKLNRAFAQLRALAAAKAKQAKTGSGMNVSLENILSRKDLDKASLLRVEGMQKYSEYFDKVGDTYKLNEKGKAELAKKGSMSPLSGMTSYNGFLTWARTGLGLSRVDNGVPDAEKIEKYYNDLMAGTSYDATKLSRVSIPITGNATLTMVKEAILNKVGEKVSIVDFNGKGYSPTDTIDRTKLASKDYTVVGISPSAVGHVVTFLGPEGTFDIEMPRGLNPASERMLDELVATLASATAQYTNPGVLKARQYEEMIKAVVAQSAGVSPDTISLEQLIQIPQFAATLLNIAIQYGTTPEALYSLLSTSQQELLQDIASTTANIFRGNTFEPLSFGVGTTDVPYIAPEYDWSYE